MSGGGGFLECIIGALVNCFAVVNLRPGLLRTVPLYTKNLARLLSQLFNSSADNDPVFETLACWVLCRSPYRLITTGGFWFYGCPRFGFLYDVLVSRHISRWLRFCSFAGTISGLHDRFGCTPACLSFGLGFLFTLPVIDGVAVPGLGRSSSGIAVEFGYPGVCFGGMGVGGGVVGVPGALFFVGL